MHIDEFGECETKGGENEISNNYGVKLIVVKRAAVGVGARMLFYPTLFYNVVRNTFEPKFHWWDQIDEFVLLGAVPFPSDVLHLKELGVCGVVTLNEPYETLVPTSLYNEYGIENLVLPTRDYLFAPSFENLCKAVDFIHKNASNGKMTYVHCKAGRGRSTTVVLCYLVEYKQMTPYEAYEYVRFRRPRVLLASSQRQAVEEFYQLRVTKTHNPTGHLQSIPKPVPLVASSKAFFSFDDSTTFVLISESDVEGYTESATANQNNKTLLADFVCRVQFARLSYFWLSCQSQKKKSKEVGNEKIDASCSVEAEQVSGAYSCLAQGVVVKL
ncbi:hypothetical protein LUZ60_014399 [Juncus effusus]|nr:hypothetical protein LUZ60_014399 [Juncus effusus]